MKITRSFNRTDRYFYDTGMCAAANGWSQLDTWQDAHYFGLWGNPFTLEDFCYAEGDEIHTQCESPEEFSIHIQAMSDYYENNGSKGIKIDVGIDRPEAVAAWESLGLGHLLY